jgi:putative AlgH/UPF0301 family transcriptional regulator
MSLRKLPFFTMLVTIAAFAAAEKLNVAIQKSSLRTPKPAHSVKFWGDREFPPAVFVPVQSRKIQDLGVGKLLVASPGLSDPNFAKTVVLLVHYSEEGVTGLILNRRTQVPLSRVFDELKAAKNLSDPVYLGGPVEVARVFALLQAQGKLEGAKHISNGVHLITSRPLFEKTLTARADPGVFHVYLGCAGWSRGQLQNEVTMGSWLIFPASADAVFHADPDSLWLQMIHTQLKLAGRKPNRSLVAVVTSH